MELSVEISLKLEQTELGNIPALSRLLTTAERPILVMLAGIAIEVVGAL